MNKKDILLQGERMRTELVLDYIHKNNLTKGKFCELAGISTSVLNKIFKQQTNFFITALYKICLVLDIEMYQFFETC